MGALTYTTDASTRTPQCMLMGMRTLYFNETKCVHLWISDLKECLEEHIKRCTGEFYVCSYHCGSGPMVWLGRALRD